MFILIGWGSCGRFPKMSTRGSKPLVRPGEGLTRPGEASTRPNLPWWGLVPPGGHFSRAVRVIHLAITDFAANRLGSIYKMI